MGKAKTKTAATTNFKTFNVTLVESESGIKVLRAFGILNPESKEPSFKRLDARNFARKLNKLPVVIK